MRHHEIRPALFVSALVVMLLTGCFGGQAKNPNFYTLVPEADSAQTSTTAEIGTQRVMLVGPIRLPEHLQRPQIVTRVEGTRLEHAEFERWAGPLESQIEARLIRNLGAELQDIAVVGHRQPGVEPAYRVSVNVREFVGRLDGHLELSATWTLTRFADQEESRQLHASEIRVAVTGPDYPSLVQAHQKALKVFSQQIADAVRQL
jgi:hypothetical protein